MSLRVFNTLTRQKEEFHTGTPGKVGMYVCGPTVYKPSHIGHMVGPVIFDTVKRYLTYLGYEVTWVVNITDVDDKLIVRARELGTTVKELAEKMTADYVECLKKLNVTGIDLMPRATEHIAEMLAMIQGLIDKGTAYPAGGDVYFDVTRDADYGKLCNRDPEQMEAGARIEVSDKKRNPGDFALWKGSKPGEPAWDSPWGKGRPGWHIECSAMSMKYLGKTFDIHGGGLDLQFPHHENELAQSESYSDQTFARYWMHNGLLKMGQSKMAGSVGNVINVVDLLQKHAPETVRFLLLSTHYRSPIEYSEKRLAEVDGNVQSFRNFFRTFRIIAGVEFFELPAPKTLAESKPLTPTQRNVVDGFDISTFMDEFKGYQRKFSECMSDDFNTAGAIGVLFEFLNGLNRLAAKIEGKASAVDVTDFRASTTVFRELCQILGLFLSDPRQPRIHEIRAQGAVGMGDTEQLANSLAQFVTKIGQAPHGLEVNQLMAQLIAMRAQARKSRNFDLADQIRNRLTELGITLEDRPGGTGWRIG